MFFGKRVVYLLTSLLLLAGANCAKADDDWNDFYIGYRYGFNYSEPYEGNAIPKNVLTFSYSGSYIYGTNYANLDVLQSTSGDPVLGNPNQGATEAYFVYRNVAYASKVFGGNYQYGWIRDFGATAGFDWNTKNNAYQSEKRMMVVGPTIMLDVPGFVNASVLALWESNHPSNCAYANNLPASTCNPATAIPNGRYYYKLHPSFNLVWGVPFEIGTSRFLFKGFLDYIATKGNLESGNPSGPETHLDTAIMYDLSPSFGLKKDMLQIGFEYEYWLNKFGNYNSGSAGNPAYSSPTPNSPNGALGSTPAIRIEFHF